MAREFSGYLIWPAMTWIALIEQELPRLRLYASALLGDLKAGDTAVEEALSDLIRYHLPAQPSRCLLFCLVDFQVRDVTAHTPADRAELLTHICGFSREECEDIFSWNGLQPLKSVS